MQNVRLMIAHEDKTEGISSRMELLRPSQIESTIRLIHSSFVLISAATPYSSNSSIKTKIPSHRTSDAKLFPRIAP
jgi:hypothetical protein